MTKKNYEKSVNSMKKALFININADSTGADGSGADNTVSKALFTHSFPRSGPKN